MATTTAPTQEERNAAATAILHGEGWHDDPAETLEPESAWDDCRYEVGSVEYLILTDAEADERTADYIRESLWAFNADFLASFMPEGIDVDVIDAIRGDRCEDANATMLALVEAGPQSFAELVEEAISADGRGHFLAGYDGEEITANPDGRYWYAYRVN